MDEHWPKTPSTLRTRPGYLTPRQKIMRLVLILIAVAVGIAARHLEERTEEDIGDVEAAAVPTARPSAHPHTPDGLRDAATTVR